LKYFPSKKIVLTFLSLSIAAAGIFILSGSRLTNNDLSFERGADADVLLKSTTAKDSDNDGLKDWEESLWGTDPENPDTDGDGTKDGEEASLGRNPLKEGPDDKMNDVKFISSKNSSVETPGSLSEPKTLTEALSRELFTEYVTLKNSGDFTEGDEEELVNSLLSKISLEISFDKYALEDIFIVPNSKEAAMQYLENMSEVIVKYMFSSDIKDESEIITKVAQSGGKEGTEELDPIINLYRSATRELLPIKTPSGIADQHVMLINSTSGIAEALSEMKEMENDPVLGLFALQKYITYWQTLNEATNEIMAYMKNIGAISPKATEDYLKILSN